MDPDPLAQLLQRAGLLPNTDDNNNDDTCTACTCPNCEETELNAERTSHISSILGAGDIRSQLNSFTTKTADATLTTAERTILADATSGNITLTLPPAANYANGDELLIIKTDSTTNSVTIDANAAETINGALTQTLLVRYKILRLRTDQTTWYIIDSVAIDANGDYILADTRGLEWSDSRIDRDSASTLAARNAADSSYIDFALSNLVLKAGAGTTSGKIGYSGGLQVGNGSSTLNVLTDPGTAPSTVTPVDNTNRTPSATRPTLVILQCKMTSAVTGDDTSWTVTIGSHALNFPLRLKNASAAGATLSVSITFLVPAGTTYKVAKTDNSGTPTTSYSAEEVVL